DSSATISDASLYSLAFGARADGSRGENMLIDQIQFYDTELSAIEITALYRGVSLADGGNPIITHIYTADPSAHVWEDGKIWIYPSHDQDDATSYNSMNGHHVFSSEDLVNWTDHGEIMHTDDISWAKTGNLWAPDCAFKDGTYYYYYPARDKDGVNRVGVATSSSPAGPFVDSGSYIPETDEIDPACFVDDDGQAYLYWGGHYGDLRIAKLNDDMKSHSGVTKLSIPHFYEAPWMHKRNGIYYLSYATGTQAPIAYCTSTSPMGPFTYQGVILAKDMYGSVTNHHSIVKFRGHWYIFYHSIALSGLNHRRSVCIDYLFYNEDGTIRQVVQTDEGVAPALLVDNEDNYPFIQAENYTSASGVSIQSCSDTDGGEQVKFLEAGAELTFDLDIYNTFTKDVAFRVSSERADIAFDLYDGTNLLGSVSRLATGSAQNWTTLYMSIPLEVGSMDLRVVATGGDWNLNWIEFSTIFNVKERVNKALNQTASASSVHSSGYAAGNAVDGDANTRWAAKVDTPWLAIDFGVPTVVNGIKISEYKEARITGYEIQYFDDGWVTAFVGDSIVDGVIYDFPSVVGTQFRLLVTSATGGPTITELELYGASEIPEPAMNIDSGSISLMWSGEPGSTYALQYSTNLAVDTFSTIESGIPALEATNINRMAMPDAAAFYRVILE
ncbi:family 43 glycosylhydrolase, partial [Pontiellaceae bacterium B12219]|nr:family 43 glycosylhydrolase [Pontiellaceae bacterium B12219]